MIYLLCTHSNALAFLLNLVSFSLYTPLCLVALQYEPLTGYTPIPSHSSLVSYAIIPIDWLVVFVFARCLLSNSIVKFVCPVSDVMFIPLCEYDMVFVRWYTWSVLSYVAVACPFRRLMLEPSVEAMLSVAHVSCRMYFLMFILLLETYFYNG